MDDLAIAACAAVAPTTATLPLRVRDLGRRGYEPVWHAMQGFTDTRGADTRRVWLVEHEAVSRSARPAARTRIGAGDIPVLRVERGGQ